MFKLIVILSALCAAASAGYLGGYGLSDYGHSGYGHGSYGLADYGLASHGYGGHGYGLGYSGYSGVIAPAYHSPALVASAPILKTYSAPVVKTIAPLATSYANTYKVVTKSIPVVHTAPAVYAAPAYLTSSTYHGAQGQDYGYGRLLH